MKRLAGAIAILLYLSLSAFSQTAADRDRAMKYLESTKQGVINATDGLSDAQWNFKPEPDRWSVAEVTEHIAAAEGFIRGMIVEQVMKAPARPDGDDVAALDELVMAKVPDRSNKRQAPDPIKPTNRYGSGPASLKAFMDSRAQTEEFLTSHDDLRAHATDSPFGKKLDGYQWVLYIAAHSERHTKQILEVKADPNFPKK